MGAGNSKDKDKIYDIPLSSLDPSKPDPEIGRFQDYKKGEQFNMDDVAAVAAVAAVADVAAVAASNRNIIITIILLCALCTLCTLLFFRIRKK